MAWKGGPVNAADVTRAVAAAKATAVAVDLRVDDAIVLHNSNRIAVHLRPCDVLARVAPASHHAVGAREVEVALRLTDVGGPVAELDPRVPPRVHVQDGFVVTLWTYYEPRPGEVAPVAYAHALARLHAAMGQADLSVPRFTARVAEAQGLLADRRLTPDLADADRALLDDVLHRVSDAVCSRGRTEQVLHGEPHPGNLLNTARGLVFIDLETCCRGPVEFDIAHAPEEVGEHYPGVDRELLGACRILTLALATTWRWDRDDDLPNGRQLAFEWIEQIRTALDGPGIRLYRM